MAKEAGRILTDKQAARLAKQAGKFDRHVARSQKGITVESGPITVEKKGNLRIVHKGS